MEENLDKIEKWPKEEYKEKPSIVEDKEAVLEKKELTEEEKDIHGELEKELQKVKLSSQAQAQAQKEAEDLKKETVKGKVKRLLDLAQSKGLAYSVEVVKKMDDAYLLDLFHDTLAKGGLFKKFLGK